MSGSFHSRISLNTSDGVISGLSMNKQESVATIEGKTSGITPSQSVTKIITIRSEPAMAFTVPRQPRSQHTAEFQSIEILRRGS
ncbi:MAG: hypothetical protein LBR42_03200 [Candidatus Methanoplasma sp.]|jgi:hypothetical protein|nr:hypothetical protein [Candidatus Methanoplasma sp.]